MTRDMELIRKMVLMMDEHPTGFAPKMQIDGYTSEQIGYHAYLLIDSGLASGPDITSSADSGPMYRLRRLTSAGHDFADNARTQYIWDEVMADIKSKGIASATIAIVKDFLDHKIRTRLKGE